jgi:hypothetical protein
MELDMVIRIVDKENVDEYIERAQLDPMNMPSSDIYVLHENIPVNSLQKFKRLLSTLKMNYVVLSEDRIDDFILNLKRIS